MYTLPQQRAAAVTHPFPPSSILVPMDLTEASMIAWSCARTLADRFGASTQALYVQPWLVSAAGMGGVEPYLNMEVEQAAFDELKRKLGPGAHVEAELGAVEPAILQRSRPFDLLVVGAHARSGVERALRGSIAEALLRDSRKPVLVARAPLGPIRQVLAPINFEPYAWDAFLFAARAAAAFGATLTVLHVMGHTLARGADVSAPMRLLNEWISGLPDDLASKCGARGRLDFGSPAERIANATREADLIVLAAHRKGLLADAFGTTAERVLRHCPIPVLAVPSSAGR